MGTSTFANFTVLPEIAVAKIREDAPFDKVCYIGCGVTTGIGAVINTAKVTPGANCVVFGLGGIGLNVIQGLRLAGADMIIGVDVNPEKKAWGERFGMTHFVNPKEVAGDLVTHLVELTKGGADYSFECIGNVDLMRTALECCHKGWGESIIIGVAPAGAEIRTRPFQLVTGRVWRGSAFGGAGGRTDVPKIVDWYTPTPRIRRPPLAKRRDPDSTERMIRPGFLDIKIAAKPDRVGSGRVGRSSSGPTCERAGVARRWDELRGDCEGPVAGRRHHPHLVSPV